MTAKNLYVARDIFEDFGLVIRKFMQAKDCIALSGSMKTNVAKR